MEKEQHNGTISIWKFIFCLVIAVFHGKLLFPNGNMPIFKGGYIAVEFFFIVSGIYFAKSALKETKTKKPIGEETVSFIWNKLKKLLPYIVISYIMSITFYQFFNSQLSISQKVNSIWNVLLIKEFGFRGFIISSAWWYLTGMYASMFVLYPFIKKYKENFILNVSPIIVLVLLGYLSARWGHLDQSFKVLDGHLSTGMLRAFAEINLGMIVYYINQKLKNIEYTKTFRIALTLISEAFLIAVLIIISVISRHSEYDYVMLAMIATSILIINSGKTIEKKLFSNKFIFFLEKISMPIFINHQFFFIVIWRTEYFNRFTTTQNVIMYLSSAVVFSIIEYLIISKVQKKEFPKIKKLFIVEKKKKTT